MNISENDLGGTLLLLVMVVVFPIACAYCYFNPYQEWEADVVNMKTGQTQKYWIKSRHNPTLSGSGNYVKYNDPWGEIIIPQEATITFRNLDTNYTYESTNVGLDLPLVSKLHILKSRVDEGKLHDQEIHRLVNEMLLR